MNARQKYHELIAAGREAARRTNSTVKEPFGEVVLHSYPSGTHHWFHRDGGRDITNSLRAAAALELIAKELRK